MCNTGKQNSHVRLLNCHTNNWVGTATHYQRTAHLAGLDLPCWATPTDELS